MTVKATHRVSGVTVTADEAVIALLGPEWETATEKAPKGEAPSRRARKKATDDDGK